MCLQSSVLLWCDRAASAERYELALDSRVGELSQVPSFDQVQIACRLLHFELVIIDVTSVEETHLCLEFLLDEIGHSQVLVVTDEELLSRFFDYLEDDRVDLVSRKEPLPMIHNRIQLLVASGTYLSILSSLYAERLSESERREFKESSPDEKKRVTWAFLGWLSSRVAKRAS